MCICVCCAKTIYNMVDQYSSSERVNVYRNYKITLAMSLIRTA